LRLLEDAVHREASGVRATLAPLYPSNLGLENNQKPENEDENDDEVRLVSDQTLLPNAELAED